MTNQQLDLEDIVNTHPASFPLLKRTLCSLWASLSLSWSFASWFNCQVEQSSLRSSAHKRFMKKRIDYSIRCLERH